MFRLSGGIENRGQAWLNSPPFMAVILLAWMGLASPAGAQSDIENWVRWEQTLTTTRDYHLNGGNPYRNLTLKVTYTPVSCVGSPWCQTFTGYGFWDGGRTFKVRSAFPEGTWSWKVTCSGAANGFDCSTDPALDSVLGGTQTTTTATGTVNVLAATGGADPSNPYLDGIPWRGFIRISSDRRYLTYGDGISKFFWQADTAWPPAAIDFTSNTRWTQFLTDRRGRKLTVVLMAIAPDNDSRTITSGGSTISVFDDVGTNCLGATWPKSCSQWNPVYFQNLDEKVRLANSKGFLVMLVGVMDPLGNLNNASGAKYPNPDDAAIFARNLAARLSGSHVVFSPSFDDPLSSTSTLMDWVGGARCAPRLPGIS